MANRPFARAVTNSRTADVAAVSPFNFECPLVSEEHTPRATLCMYHLLPYQSPLDALADGGAFPGKELGKTLRVTLVDGAEHAGSPG